MTIIMIITETIIIIIPKIIIRKLRVTIPVLIVKTLFRLSIQL